MSKTAQRAVDRPSTRSGIASKLLGTGGIYALVTAAPILSTLLVTPLVTRQLGGVEFGVVGLGISLYQMASLFLALGLPAAITRHAIVERSGLRGAVGIVMVGAGFALSLAVLAVLTTPIWGPMLVGDDERRWVLAAPVASALGLAWVTLSQSLLRAVDRAGTFVAIGASAALLPPVLGLVSITQIGAVADIYLVGLAVGHVAVGAAALVVVRLVGRPAVDSDDMRSAFRIGLPTVPHQVSTALLSTTLVVLASRIGGIEDAGRMQIALLLGTAPMVIIGALNNSWAPMVYRAAGEDRSAVLARTTELVSIATLILVGGFCAVVGILIGIIAGPDIASRGQTSAAALIASAAPFMVLYLSNVHLVFLKGNTGLLAITTPLSFALAAGAGTLAALKLPDILAALSLAVPCFYALQWIMAVMLRRRTGYRGPRLAGAMPYLVAGVTAAAVTAIQVLTPGYLIIALGSTAMAAVGIAFLLRRAERRRQQR